MSTVPQGRDSTSYYLEGLLQLQGARDVIDAILGGVWHGDRVLTEHIVDYVRAAGEHFHRSELCGGRAA